MLPGASEVLASIAPVLVSLSIGPALNRFREDDEKKEGEIDGNGFGRGAFKEGNWCHAKSSKRLIR
jgi:hypothetical protein